YVDSDATTFFFFQAVGVDAGQSLDQRGFAVVNVSGGAYDYRFHVCVSISCDYIYCRTVARESSGRDGRVKKSKWLLPLMIAALVALAAPRSWAANSLALTNAIVID